MAIRICVLYYIDPPINITVGVREFIVVTEYSKINTGVLHVYPPTAGEHVPSQLYGAL